MEKLIPTQMLSVARCISILEKEGLSHSTEEVLLIRDFLYMLAEYEFAAYLNEKRRDLEFNNNVEQQLNEAA